MYKGWLKARNHGYCSAEETAQGLEYRRDRVRQTDLDPWVKQRLFALLLVTMDHGTTKMLAVKHLGSAATL